MLKKLRKKIKFDKKYLLLIIIIFIAILSFSYFSKFTWQVLMVTNETPNTKTTTTIESNSKKIISGFVDTNESSTTKTTTSVDDDLLEDIKTSTVTTVSNIGSGGGSGRKTTSTVETTIKPVAKVIINEIMYNPDGSDTGNEWVEIFNNDTFDCDIVDWKLYEGDANHRLSFNNSQIIPSLGYAVISNDLDNFLLNYPDFNGTLIYSSFSLSNTGEEIALKDYSSKVVDNVTYNNSWGGDGNNKTLERISNEWNESLVFYGTPGFENSILNSTNSTYDTTSTTTTSTSSSSSTTTSTTSTSTSSSTTSTSIISTSTTSTTTSSTTSSSTSTSSSSTTTSTTSTTTTIPILANHVVISEVYYDVNDESCSEFVELYNPTGSDVNISDWVIATPKSSTDATIPLNSSIKPYGFYLIADSCWYSGKDNSTWPDADHNETITLSNDDGWVILKDNFGITVDMIGWGSAINYEGNQTVDVNGGKSLERKPGYLNITAGNGWDTDNNLEDFIVRNIPEPQNSTYSE